MVMIEFRVVNSSRIEIVVIFIKFDKFSIDCWI